MSASTATPAIKARMGDPIKGPSALGNDTQRLRRLIWTLATTDFKLKFFGSVLGYLWQVMQPLMLFGVLYVVFSLVLNFSGTEKYYPVALLLGIVLFSFLSETTTGAVRSVGAREPLVRKIEFPRIAIPSSQVLLSLFNLGLNLVPVFVFLLIAGGDPLWTWLELPVIVLLFGVLALGLSMMLSALWVRYRDVDPIWSVALQALFYASPIIYPISTVQIKAPEAAKYMMFNPFAALLQQARHALMGPTHPTPAAVMGGDVWLLVPLLVIIVVFALGARIFVKMAPVIAEEL